MVIITKFIASLGMRQVEKPAIANFEWYNRQGQAEVT